MLGLASTLINSSKEIDSELDSLFKSTETIAKVVKKKKIVECATEMKTIPKNIIQSPSGPAIPIVKQSKPKVDSIPKPQETGSRRALIKAKIEANEKTVFVGNLNVLVTEKANVKALKKLFSAHGPLASIRFRSIAFSAKLPRKVAFISKQFHESRDSLNAYIEYKEMESVEKALALNGTLFLEKHIRVDVADQTKKKEHPELSVFVGNLPFNVSDEQVYGFFSEFGDLEYVRIVR